jgi:virulence-associated protein VapD
MDRRPYVISFDLCAEARSHYYAHRSGGYDPIKKRLKQHGFNHVQNSLYINNSATQEEAEAALSALTELVWFSASATRVHLFQTRPQDTFDRSKSHEGCRCLTKPRKRRGRPPVRKPR